MMLIRQELELLPYPIDMSPLWAFAMLDEAGVPYSASSASSSPAYHPRHIVEDALAHWNAFLRNGEHEHREAFILLATWLLTHESSFADDAGGWPIPLALHAYHALQPWLSASTQGQAISVLVRAYQVTGEEAFLRTAQRAVRTFERDILDGGVSAPVGEDSVFFEEVAVYPAAHILKGNMLALFGLYDYVALTGDGRVKTLIQRSLSTLHVLLDEFDTGYWTRSDLLHKHLASWSDHSSHITLLEALARYSECERCKALAARWREYLHRPGCRLRYLLVSRMSTLYEDKLQPGLRRLIFRTANTQNQTSPVRVCVPVTAFPIAGGTRSVLAGVAQVMGEQWQMTYLTRHKGQGAEGLQIEVFGGRLTVPWQFPGVWLYCMAGWHKLFVLLRQGTGYDLILPQDGVFTAAFATVLGKLAGVRVVCMDHGHMTCLDKSSFRMELEQAVEAYPWPRRILARLLLPGYWSSLRLLAWIATRYADHFLVAGDEVAEVYHERFDIHPSRITRYVYMIDPARFTPPDRASRAKMRMEQGIPEEAILIILINRLAPEKGLDLALEGITLALSTLPPEVQTRVRVLIAGDGPLRSQLETAIRQHSLDSVCILWGEATPTDVVTLLGIADIFLYSGTRGTNYSMAILEAMAAECAVVASVSPRSNAKLLAEGRGIPILPGDINAIGDALARLCSDLSLCQQMGQMAREYVATHHSASMLKRNLLRASFFAPSIGDSTGGQKQAQRS